MYQWLTQALIIAYDSQHNLQSPQYSDCGCDHSLQLLVTVTYSSCLQLSPQVFNCLWPWPQFSIAYECHHNLACDCHPLFVIVTNCLWLWLQFSFAYDCHHNLQLLMAVTIGKLQILVTINYPKLQLLMTATFRNFFCLWLKLEMLISVTSYCHPVFIACDCHPSFNCLWLLP